MQGPTKNGSERNRPESASFQVAQRDPTPDDISEAEFRELINRSSSKGRHHQDKREALPLLYQYTCAPLTDRERRCIDTGFRHLKGNVIAGSIKRMCDS